MSGLELIADEAWGALRQRLAQYLVARSLRWRDASFSPRSPFFDEQSEFRTSVVDESARLPQSGRPIRGLPGVKAAIEGARASYGVFDQFQEWRFGLPGKAPDTYLAAEAAGAGLMRVFTEHPPLRRRLMRVIWGALGAETSDAREISASLGGDSQSIVIAIQRVAADELERQGVTVESLATARIDDDLVDAVLARIKEDAYKERAEFEVIALLSGPHFDLENASICAWSGKWFEAPCELDIGYPDDELCTVVVRGLGYKHLPRDSNLSNTNLFVRLQYSLPVALGHVETVQAHHRSGDYLRLAVDALRILMSGDIGILHMYGHAPDRTSHLRLAPPFLAAFTEGPAAALRQPVRRVFDLPEPESRFSDLNDVHAFAGLFQQLVAEVPEKVPGLAIALDRFRAVYERFAPEDPNRTIDCVTALEALFLSDGLKDELKFRLQLRVARLLETKLERRLTLARDVATLYDFRSALVHGAKRSRKDEKKASAAEIGQLALALLRKSLFFFLIEPFAKDKSSEGMRAVWLRLAMEDGGSEAESAAQSGQPAPELNTQEEGTN